MPIIDKLTDAYTETSKVLAIGEIAAAVFFNSQQIPGFKTRAEIKTLLNLDDSDDAQLDEIAEFLSGMTTNEKLVFSLRVFFGGILWERKKITGSQFKNLVGIT